MSEPQKYSVRLRRHVAGTTVAGTRSLKIKRGTLGSDLESAAKKEYGLTLMSMELRLGGPKGTLIADDANIWQAICVDRDLLLQLLRSRDHMRTDTHAVCFSMGPSKEEGSQSNLKTTKGLTPPWPALRPLEMITGISSLFTHAQLRVFKHLFHV